MKSSNKISLRALRLCVTISFFCLFTFFANAQPKVWTLKDCMEQALQKNIQVAQSQLKSDINKITLEQSKYNRVPTLNGTATQGFGFGRSLDPFSNQFVDNNVKSNNFSLNSNIILFNGFQNQNTIKQNQLEYQASDFDVLKMKNDIVLNVALAYMQVLFTYEQIDVAKKKLEATEGQVEQTQKLLDVGKVTLSNLLQIKSQLATDKLSLISAENQLQVTKVTLMQLMEIPITADFDVEKPVLQEPQDTTLQTTEEIFKTALDNQPQIKSAASRTESALTGLKIAIGGQMPRLSLTGAVNTGYSSSRSINSLQTQYETKDIGYLKSNPLEIVSGVVPVSTSTKQDYAFGKQFSDNFAQSLSFNLSVPIFNNRQVKSNIEKSKINIQNAQLNEQFTKNQLRKTIEQSYTDYTTAAKKYDASKEQLSAIGESYLISEKKFNLGMLNAIDFLIEKNNFFKAKSDLLQAKYDLIFKSKVLDFYQGKQIQL